MTFSDALQKIKDTLDASPGLQSFASYYGKSMNISLVYKNRQELNIADLPAIMLTRPSVKKRFQTGVRDATHTVIMYCVFQQDDRNLGPRQLIELEELIDDAIISDVTLGGTVLSAIPDDSTNDEGKNHPIYCMILSMEVQHRRLT